MRNVLFHTALLSAAGSAFGQFAAPITARADATPASTVTLQPRSDYIKSPDPSIAPSGTEVIILPTEVGDKIPKSGIDIFFGPDTAKKLRTTLDEKCADGATADCTNQLTEDINAGRSYDLAKRVVGIDDVLGLAAVTLVGVISAAIKLYTDAQAQPVGVHLESSVLAQVESKTQSSVVIVTASDDSHPITVPVKTTSAPETSTGTATIKTLSADASGHHSGDIIITLPTDTADKLEQLIRQTGQCPNTPVNQKKRGPGGGGDMTTITDVAKFVLPMAAPAQLLHALALQAAQRLPDLRDAAQQASLDAVQAFAASLPEFRDVATAFRDLIAEAVWWSVYDFCAQQVNDLTEQVIEEEWVVEDNNEDENGEDCPKDAPSGINAPLCETCDGSENKICTSGKWKNCICLGRIDPWYFPGDRDLWNTQQEVLDGLLSDKGEPSPDCDEKKRLSLERDLYTGLVSTFCKDFDLGKDKEEDLTNKDGGKGSWDGYADYNFHFQWTKGDEQCSDGCEDIFNTFAKSSSCSYDTHTFASSGSLDASCGTASFNFTKDKKNSGGDAPAPAPTQNVDLGILTCGTHNDQGNPTYFTTLDSMNDAIDRFCDWAAEQGRVFSSGKVSGDDATVELRYNNQVNDPIKVSLTWRDANNCPVLDFKNDADNAKNICKARLADPVNLCDTAANGKHWWKQGGTFFRDCVDWTIARDHWRDGSPGTSDDYRPPKTCESYDDCTSECGNRGAFCAGANGPSYCSCAVK